MKMIYRLEGDPQIYLYKGTLKHWRELVKRVKIVAAVKGGK